MALNQLAILSRGFGSRRKAFYYPDLHVDAAGPLRTKGYSTVAERLSSSHPTSDNRWLASAPVPISKESAPASMRTGISSRSASLRIIAATPFGSRSSAPYSGEGLMR